MASVTLRDLYAAELHDLMNAEKQILEELPVMAGRATSLQLRRAFDDHHGDTQVQVERLRLLIEQLNEPAHAVPAGAVAALIEDARRRLADAERGDILDAALIAAAQRIEHYEMASYGTARSFATSLGDDDAARILQQSLDEEGRADHRLTKLAVRGINEAAAEDLVKHPTRYRSRLRYVASKDLPGAREEGELHLHNHEGEHLGTLDGFITDSQSGQPIYYVIDSDGWFAGGRYVVPAGQIVGDAADATALHTTLTREALSRYPEFSASAFTVGDDDAVTQPRRDAAPVRTVPAPSPETGAYERTTLPPPDSRFPSSDSGFRLARRPVQPSAQREVGSSSEGGNPACPPKLEERAGESRVPNPENEQMTARGPSTSPGPGAAERDGEAEPRIERYRDR